MKPRRRFLTAILLVLLLIAGSLIFPSLTLTIVVEPITRGLWLALNLFRAVDQQIYWGLLVAVVIGFGLLLLPKEGDRARRPAGTATCPRDALAEWEQVMTVAGEGSAQRELLQRRLNELGQAIGGLAENDAVAGLTLKARPKGLAASLRAAFDRFRPARRARESLDYEQDIERYLASLESIMEIRYDSDPNELDDHR